MACGAAGRPAARDRLKLCVASPHFYPTYGGAQLRYLRYLPGLRERGVDAWVATGTPLVEERTESDRDRQWYAAAPGRFVGTETVDGTPVRRVRLPDEKSWRRSRIFYRSVVTQCREPALRPDAVQFVSNLRARAIPWLEQLRREGIPVLYSVSQFPTWPAKPRKRLYRGWVYRALYNRLDAIVTNSEPLERFLRGIGVGTRIEMIPNGVDLTRFHPVHSDADRDERAALRRALGLGAADRVVATLGAVVPRKGHDLLLEAWVEVAKRDPAAHLLVVGPRADLHDPKLVGFRARLEALVAASGAPERIHFAGSVGDVERYLRAADVFALPSQREGFPNSVLEAMASALPVVVTPFVGFSERIGRPARELLQVERTPRALAETLCALLSDADRRAALGDAARAWVGEHLGVERSLDRYAALYHELAQR